MDPQRLPLKKRMANFEPSSPSSGIKRPSIHHAPPSNAPSYSQRSAHLTPSAHAIRAASSHRASTTNPPPDHYSPFEFEPTASSHHHFQATLRTDHPENDGQVSTFEKKAIWRQMLEYKRQYQRSSQHLMTLQDRLYSTHGELLSCHDAIHVIISHLLDFEHCLLPSTRESSSSESGMKLDPEFDDSLPKDSAELTSTLQSYTLDRKRDIIFRILSRISKKVQLVLPKPPPLDAESITDTKGQLDKPDSIPSLLNRIEFLSAKLTDSDSVLHKHEARATFLGEELDKTKQELAYAEKRADRLRMAVAQSSSITASTSESGRPISAGPSSATPSAAVSAAPTPSIDKATAEALEQLQEQVHSLQVLSESRMNELQKMSKERVEILHDLTLYTSRSTSSEAVQNSSIYRDLEYKFKYKCEQADQLLAKLDQVSQELQASQAERRAFQADLVADEEGRRNTLEAEVARLETDLVRVRRHRDDIQSQLSTRTAKDEAAMKGKEELKALNAAQTKRIAVMESRMRRLMAHAAQGMGDVGLMDFFLEAEDLEQANPLTYLREKNKELEDKIVTLTSELESATGSSSSVSSDVADLHVARAQIHKLQEQLQKVPSIPDLESKIAFYQKTEASLIAEIETIGASWAELSEQNSKKIFSLMDKEESNSRVYAEKAKLDQKCASLTRQVGTLKELTATLRKQSDKQLEQIRKIEERDRNVSQQCLLLDRQVASLTHEVGVHRRKAAEAFEQVDDATSALARSKEESSSIQSALQDRLAMVEELRLAKIKAQEVQASSERKIQQLTTRLSSSITTDSTSETLNQYKLLLKCSSCNNRFKNRCILKCMHTFCAECLDALIASRQRKCPTCGIAFGQADVKEIFL